MSLNRRLQQQALLNKKLQRLLNSSIQQTEEIKTNTNTALQVADDAIKPAALSSGLASKANLVHTHLASDITGLSSVATSGLYTDLSGYPNISYVSNFASSDITLTAANTYYNCASVTLTSGTWLLLGTSTIGRTATTAGNYNLRISTGTTHYASTQHYHASVANNYASLSCNAIITVSTSTIIYLQAAGSITSDVVKAVTTTNASGANATGLIGIRLT